MKNLLLALLLLASPLVCVTGCHTTSTQQQASVNSLNSIHATVDVAFNSYLDMVVQRQISFRSLPIVARAYTSFQKAYNAAVALSGSTNAPVSEVITTSAQVLSEIQKAKKAK